MKRVENQGGPRNRAPALKTAAVAYGGVWSAAVLVYWLFCQESRAGMFHAVVNQFVVLPVTTFVLSLLIAKRQTPGKYLWLVPVFSAVMYTLSYIVTISLQQFILGGHAAIPNHTYLVAGGFVSILGLLTGWIWRKLRG